jgi:Ser/Thr protein kinase RdoA (MazF antagonist)
MPDTAPCPLCGRAARHEYHADTDGHRYRCDESCGGFWTDGAPTAFAGLTEEQRRQLIVANRNLNHYWCSRRYDDASIAALLRDHDTAAAMAREYGLDGARVEYAGGCDGDSPLYLVVADCTRYTLRLHHRDRPYGRVRSECVWLDTLRASGVGVPDTVRAADGRAIVEIPDALDGRRDHAVVHTWVDAAPLQLIPGEEKVARLYERVGEAIGRMHGASESFCPPEWFQAPTRGLAAVTPAMAEAGDAHGAAMSRLVPALEPLSHGYPDSGLIHGDLTGLNVLDGPEGVCIVDWGGLRWGYFAADIALFFADEVAEGLREAFAAGYERVRPLPALSAETIDLFSAACAAGLI